MKWGIAARRIGWLALAFCCAGAQSNVMAADMKESKEMSQNLPAEFSTLRPIRTPERIVLTVGQGEGDLQGKDDKIIQAAVDYVFRLGGGTVRILPGTYTMRNSVFLRPGITLRGSGDRTVLKKAPSVSTPVVREADWFEYCLRVADPKGFSLGCGIAVTNNKYDLQGVRFFTVTAIRENVLCLDRRTEKNYWMQDAAKVQTLYSILYALNADDVKIEDIVLDGDRAENEYLDGNFGAGVFMQYCNRWDFRNVAIRDFNGDAFSFQVCDDVHFDHCQALNCANNGFHAGSGSQRPTFKNCVAKNNLMGLTWCWGVCDGVVEDCTFSENIQCGTNFGHRDTDNVMRNCVLERNGKTGILFRKLDSERGPGDRNRIEGCLIRDNGGTGECGVDIEWETTDIAIVNCRFENSKDGKQKIAIRISPEAGKITLDGNTFTNCPVEVLDQRVKAVK